jgi:thymidylate synthase ThyX
MTDQVTLTLPDPLYERIQLSAQLEKRGLAEAIVEHLEKTWPTTEVTQSTNNRRQQQHEALAREEAAYLRLYPQLQATHRGRYVAVYQGRLIDEDSELGAMVERVRRNYPHQVVWMTQVKDEPIQTIVKRGNRFLRNGKYE